MLCTIVVCIFTKCRIYSAKIFLRNIILNLHWNVGINSSILRWEKYFRNSWTCLIPKFHVQICMDHAFSVVYEEMLQREGILKHFSVELLDQFEHIIICALLSPVHFDF